MRVFVLCTGRCGSVTLARACRHITNYSSGHETRNQAIAGRLDYPDGHIEVDNRLAWHLGELADRYDRALFVHLTRDPEAVAASYASRFGVRAGIMPAYATGIIRARPPQRHRDRLAAARAYVATVTANITQFLTGRPHLTVPIEDPHDAFDDLWDRIGATGDRWAAHQVLDTVHHRGQR